MKAEKALKRVEGEWESLNTELIQARVDVSKMQSQSSFTDKEVTQMREQIDDLKEQVERSQRYRHEVLISNAKGKCVWVTRCEQNECLTSGANACKCAQIN